MSTDPRLRWRPTALAPATPLRVVDAVELDSPAELYIYDAIDSWGGPWGVSASDVAAALSGIRASNIALHLNSPGGDYFEGVAIYNLLAAHAGTITVHVDGLAASAASVIAMAGERIVMGQGAQLMIHDAASFAIGNAADLRETADLLDKISDDIAGFYARKAGGDAETWRAAMRVETWFSADEAVAAGLADEVTTAPAPAVEPAATANAARWITAWHYPGREAAPDPVVAPAAAVASPAPELPRVASLSELVCSALTDGTVV